MLEKQLKPADKLLQDTVYTHLKMLCSTNPKVEMPPANFEPRFDVKRALAEYKRIDKWNRFVNCQTQTRKKNPEFF